MVLIVGLVPEPVKVYGLGFIGAFVLWLANLRLVWNEQALGVRLWAFAEASA